MICRKYIALKKDQFDVLITVQQVSKMTAISVRCLWNLRRDQKLPTSIQISNRIVRWRKIDIQLWIEWGCPDENEFESMKTEFLQGRPFPRISR